MTEETSPLFENSDTEDTAAAKKAAARAFGVDNRRRLLARYFREAGDVSAANAWVHVYRLLLWVDRTIGLAHCYESDKSQPGRPWYARTLRFHDWISSQLGTEPGALAHEIDWLFTHAVDDLAQTAARRRVQSETRLAAQRLPYEDRGFPEPGEDPELTAIILSALEGSLASEPPPAARRTLAERVTAYMASENKRKNLLGEGFEDTPRHPDRPHTRDTRPLRHAHPPRAPRHPRLQPAPPQ